MINNKLKGGSERGVMEIKYRLYIAVIELKGKKRSASNNMLSQLGPNC